MHPADAAGTFVWKNLAWCPAKATVSTVTGGLQRQMRTLRLRRGCAADDEFSVDSGSVERDRSAVDVVDADL
jgi:hypothetical protein